MNRHLVAFAPGDSRSLARRSSLRAISPLLLAASVVLPAACGGGGGGSSSYDAHGTLLSITFPDSSDPGGDATIAPSDFAFAVAAAMSSTST